MGSRWPRPLLQDRKSLYQSNAVSEFHLDLIICFPNRRPPPFRRLASPHPAPSRAIERVLLTKFEPIRRAVEMNERKDELISDAPIWCIGVYGWAMTLMILMPELLPELGSTSFDLPFEPSRFYS